MATNDNLTNLEEYPKTSFPFPSEPITGSSIYGKMKENKPIILPPTYQDSSGIIDEPKIFETIYYDENDNKIKKPQQNKDPIIFNKDDFSSSLTVTVYNTNDNLTSDQLENTERKFYNNVMSNSNINISHEISEETNYNNMVNNKSIEIGENLNIDNIAYNQFPATQDNYNYTNLLDNKTDTFTNNITNNLIFGNENIVNNNTDGFNNFNTYSKVTNNAYKDLSYEVDSKNENISYQINIITNDGQSIEYDNISNLMKTEEIKPIKINNPFDYNPQQDYMNNGNIYEEKNLVENQVGKKEEMKEEKKEVKIEEKKEVKIEEEKQEEKKEEKKEDIKEVKKEDKKENEKENEKSKVKKRSVGTQTDEDNIKCIYNYTSRKMYKPRRKSFDKFDKGNNYNYKTNYRDYKKGKLFPVYDFNTYDIIHNKKKSHSKRKKNVNVFFNPIRKVRIHKNDKQDNNYLQTNNNAYDDYIQSNSYIFNAGDNELNTIYNLPKNKSEIFSNNINFNDIPDTDTNYNYEYNLTNNNEQIGNDIIVSQNYDVNINTEIYGDNYNYENITIENEIKNNNESVQKDIFNMFQTKDNNNNFDFYDNNLNYQENYENYVGQTENNYIV